MEGRYGCIAEGRLMEGGRKVEEKKGSRGMKDVGGFPPWRGVVFVFADGMHPPSFSLS